MIYVAGSFRLEGTWIFAFLQRKAGSKMQRESLVTRKRSHLVTWPGLCGGIVEITGRRKCPWLVGDRREERLTHSCALLPSVGKAFPAINI